MSNISMQFLVRIHNKLKMKYENKQCSKPQVGIFATDSDSVPDLQQIYNQFLVDHRFKIGCNSVNDNFGQQPIYNRFSFDHRFKIGCNSVNENFGQQPIYNRIKICELIHRLKFGCKSVVKNFCFPFEITGVEPT